MTVKELKIDNIITNIFALFSSINDQRKQVIKDFVRTSINGDEPLDHLAINANLDKNREGVIVYIVTNLRLIKIGISDQEIESNAYRLNTLIGVDRKLTKDNKIEFSASFQNGSFGLRYSSNDHAISNFFQQIDTLKA